MKIYFGITNAMIEKFGMADSPNGWSWKLNHDSVLGYYFGTSYGKVLDECIEQKMKPDRICCFDIEEDAVARVLGCVLAGDGWNNIPITICAYYNIGI